MDKCNEEEKFIHSHTRVNLDKGSIKHHSKDDPDMQPSSCCKCSIRLQHAIVGLFLGFVLYLHRNNMSVALPFMVKSEVTLLNQTTQQILTHNITRVTNATYVGTSTDTGANCDGDVKNAILDAKKAEFAWDKVTQSFVLSGFFYGYLPSQIPLSMAARKFGGKKVITMCMGLSAVFTLLVPLLARANVYSLVVTRVILGIIAGATIPAWFAVLGAWALPHERSRFSAASSFGKCSGTVIGYFSAGLLCAYGFDNGWGSVFYVHGIVGILFVLVWYYIVADNADKHPRITKEERTLLKEFCFARDKKIKDVKVPIASILTSLPVWVIYITHVCDNSLQYLVQLSIPQFLKDVLKYDIQSNGAFSALPSICNALGLVISGFLSDALIKRKIFTTTVVRRLFQCTSLLGCAGFIIIPGYLDCSTRGLAVVCLCVSMFFNGLGQAVGYPCNAVDIAPQYASVIYSISNTLASLPGIFLPLAVAELAPNGTVEEWRTVFYIAAGLGLFACVLYGCLSSCELAPWAEEVQPKKEIVIDRATDSLLNITNGVSNSRHDFNDQSISVSTKE